MTEFITKEEAGNLLSQVLRCAADNEWFPVTTKHVADIINLAIAQRLGVSGYLIKSKCGSFRTITESKAAAERYSADDNWTVKPLYALKGDSK
jgi:hypothetical protein